MVQLLPNNQFAQMEIRVSVQKTPYQSITGSGMSPSRVIRTLYYSLSDGFHIFRVRTVRGAPTGLVFISVPLVHEVYSPSARLCHGMEPHYFDEC